jgi:hypothetical protein
LKMILFFTLQQTLSSSLSLRAHPSESMTG